MKQFCNAVMFFIAVLAINGPVWGNAENARFSINLFQDGMPVADAEILISSDRPVRADAGFIGGAEGSYTWRAEDGSPITTNANGSIAGKLPPGRYQISIRTRKKQQFEFDLPLRSAEDVQILVTFYADDRKPLLNIESSEAGILAGTDTQVAPAESAGVGTVSAQVLSAETQKPIKDAQVFISGLNQRLRTDEQGRVQINVPAGAYSVSLLHSAYNSQTRDNVEIVKDQLTELSFNLTPAGVELAEFVVLEPHLAGTLTAVIEEQKTSAEVATIMSAEQFSRSGDADAAAALRRASGLTLVGGQFIFIRGLGERFSSTLVNGASVPSPDPTRRVVPMDLFPTNILESVLVQKTYSPDRPGEFAGGTIELRTRGIPDEFFFNFNGQIGFVDGSTFAKGLTYKGGDLDFLSFDDGARDLPGSIENATAGGARIEPKTIFNPNGLTPAELETIGEDLSDVWDIKRKDNPPDGRMQASMGDVFNFGDFRAGYIAAAGWRQEYRNLKEINRAFIATGREDNVLTKTQEFDVRRTLQEVQLNGYFAADLEYKDKHRLFSKTMYLRQSVDEGRISQGFSDAELTDIRRTRLRFFSNQLLMQQFGGAHMFDWAKDLKVDWLYTNATADREDPKTRDYRYDEIAPNTGEFAFSRRADSNQTLFGDLKDKDESWRVDVKLPLEPSPNYKFSAESGFITQNRTRNSGIQRFTYIPAGADARNPAILAQPSLEDILQPRFIGPNGFQVRDTTRPTDSFAAKMDLFSYYGKLDANLFETLRISGGLRWEDMNQNVETFKSVGERSESIISRLDRVDMLPSVSATWLISEKQQLRAGFSQTISRPDFRELSPAPFTDMNTNQETIGNPNLKQTDVTSYDARWEYYLSPNENILVGFFWKDLTLPIEVVAVPGNAGLLTFQNADSARVYGVEFELLKNLGFIHPRLENITFGGNYTWSDSSAKLNEQNLQAQTTSNRPLQGHSQHIINFQLGYDNRQWGTQATLLYNVASERIESVGLLGAPDKYEQPFQQLDFVLSQNINKWLAMRVTMRNLLDDKFVVKQGDEVTREFRRGREFSLGVRINF
ncbi:TonB-dependent receptor [Nitrosomonas communis]|uniref:TonB-dependent receptor domain-containing protein n=1 Tax=Nitrosomonas communis TaxID=44574 RepID=UPI0026ED797E|nr:TonB-dependent receptor [Nitrosomonas communis]MCO6427350.1 TonB-dependent receptor [Nitrosomonas communis]